MPGKAAAQLAAAWLAISGICSTDVAFAGGHPPPATGYELRSVKDGVSIRSGRPTVDPVLFQRRFLAGTIRVDGVFPAVRPAVDHLIADRRGRMLTVADAFALAQAVEQAHKTAGFSLARVVVPDQVLGAGSSLVLRVVDVRVAHVGGDPATLSMARYIKAQSADLIAKPMPTATDLASIVGLAQYATGRDFSADIKETARPDRIDLQLRGPTSRVFSEVSANTFLSRPFAVSTVAAATNVYSALGLGERVSLGGSFAREDDRSGAAGPLWSFAAAATLPTGNVERSFFDVTVSTARIRLSVPDESIASYSATRANLFYTLPLFFGSESSLVVRFGAGVLVERESFAYLPAPEQDAFSIGLPYTTAEGLGSLAYVTRLPGGLTFEIGGDLAVGATRELRLDGDLDLTGVTRAIGRGTLHAKLDVPLPAGVVLSPSLRAGIGFMSPLPPGEQFQLFQSNMALPVDPRTIEGDNGAAARADVARVVATRIIDQPIEVKPFAFASAGIVGQREQLIIAAAHLAGYQLGAGFTFAFTPVAAKSLLVDGSVEVRRQKTEDETANYSALILSTRVRF